MRVATCITIALLLAAVPAAAPARPVAPGPKSAPAHTAAHGRVLKLGARGGDVRRLRRDLVRLGYLPPRAFGPSYDERVSLAVTALQKWENLPRDGTFRRNTRVAIRRQRAPVPERRLSRSIRAEVLLDRQLLLVIHRDRVIRTVAISTGAGSATPPGTFAVYSKAPMSWSKKYEVWLPWASYFNEGIAFHAYPEVPVYPASHGCVRVPVKFAREIYRLLPVGARVDVIATSF